MPDFFKQVITENPTTLLLVLYDKIDPVTLELIKASAARALYPTSEVIHTMDGKTYANTQAGALSPVDPVGEFIVSTAALSKPLEWAGKGALYGAGRLGNNWARAKVVSNAINENVSKGILLPYQIIREGKKTRFRLPEHTDAKPKEFVLEDVGNNQYNVHMRIWDGDRIPGNISAQQRNDLIDAVLNELPEGAEIAVPPSSPEYLATRGTVAGVKRIGLRVANDPRFVETNPGTFFYKDKDGTVKLFTTPGLKKVGRNVEMEYPEQDLSKIPLVFSERPTKLTDPEIKGKPKGVRNLLPPKNPINISLINRSDSYIPVEDGLFIFGNPEAAKRLSTIHFTQNKPVTGHGSGNWDYMSTTVMLPYGNVRKVVAPINIEPSDTFFPNYNGLKIPTKNAKVLTSDKNVYQYYKNAGVNVEFSDEASRLRLLWDDLDLRISKMGYGPDAIYSPERQQLIDELYNVGDKIFDIHHNWTIANRKNPTIDTYKLLERIEKGLKSGVSNDLRYGRNTPGIDLTWFSAPSTHQSMMWISPDELLSKYNVGNPEQIKYFNWLKTHNADYRKQGGKLIPKALQGIVMMSTPEGVVAKGIHGILNNPFTRPFFLGPVPSKKEPTALPLNYDDSYAVEDMVRRIKLEENSKDNPKGGYNAAQNKWYPHASVEGGAKTIGYGIKLSNGSLWASLAKKLGYLTDDLVELATTEEALRYYDSARTIYDKKFGEGAWNLLGSKTLSILGDINYNPGLGQFPKLMEAVNNEDINSMRENVRRVVNGLPLARNKGIYQDIDSIANGLYTIKK